MKIILQLFDKALGVLAIEDNKPDCIEKLTELVKDEPRIDVCVLQTKYPQGGERQLIYAVTQRAINSSMLPADESCIVDNVETILAVYNAVALGKPVTNRVATITGDAVKNPGNFLYSIGTNYAELVEAAGGFVYNAVALGKPVTNRVATITGDAVKNPGNFLYSIGTNYAELVEAAGGFCQQPKKIISGGPMMGFAMFSLDVPTTKTASSLLCFIDDEVSENETTACINCGRCVEICPERLVPARLAQFSNRDLSAQFEKWNGLECIECGSCSYICPARKQLAQSIRTMKKQVLAARRRK